MTHDQSREQSSEPKAPANTAEPTDDLRAAETEPDLDGTPPPVAPARPRPLWLRTVELLLPAALAAGAMGVHWKLNVPDKIVHSPKDQGAKDKAAKDKEKKKKDAERRRAKQRDESRTPEQLEADWEKHGTAPFDEEPTRTAWARRHQVVISRAVAEARKHAFAGAPEPATVVPASTTCRTVRCRFQLRSSLSQELDLMTSTLQRLQEAGEPVFRSFEVERLPAEPKRPNEPTVEVEHVVQVTVSFVDDDTDASSLEIPPATPEAEAAEPEKGGEPEPENGGDPNEGGEPENGGDPNDDGS